MAEAMPERLHASGGGYYLPPATVTEEGEGGVSPGKPLQPCNRRLGFGELMAQVAGCQ